MCKEIKLATRESYTKDGVRSIEPITASFIIKSPNGEQPSALLKEDVWGRFDIEKCERISNGMIVARQGQICPIFEDEVPFKSVTVVCPKKQYDDVVYWLEYVHGSDCVVMTKELDDLRIAIRSDYQCW